MNDPQDYVDTCLTSNCCGAPLLGELSGTTGLCMACKEHAEFSLEDPEDEPEEFPEPNEFPVYSCFYNQRDSRSEHDPSL